MWGYSGKVAGYKPGREISLETELSSTLILDFLPLERWENKFLLSKPPSIWYFTAALAIKYHLMDLLREPNIMQVEALTAIYTY